MAQGIRSPVLACGAAQDQSTRARGQIDAESTLASGKDVSQTQPTKFTMLCLPETFTVLNYSDCLQLCSEISERRRALPLEPGH